MSNVKRRIAWLLIDFFLHVEACISNDVVWRNGDTILQEGGMIIEIYTYKGSIFDGNFQYMLLTLLQIDADYLALILLSLLIYFQFV